jgi:hypothetical protein
MVLFDPRLGGLLIAVAREKARASRGLEAPALCWIIVP